MNSEPPPLEIIARRIIMLRSNKILLDFDLAALYGTTTKRLNEQVKRNLSRFPGDFMFQLTEEENESLRSQFATLKTGRGQHRKYLPFAFTEHGAIMAAMILNSPRATEVSVQVVRAFVQLRELVVSNKELALRLDDLERKTDLMSIKQNTCEDYTRHHIKQIIETLRELMTPPAAPPKRPIGFITPEERPASPRTAGARQSRHNSGST